MDMLEADPHPSYLTIYRSIGGWKVVLLEWNPDLGGFYEPAQTGVGSYADPKSAEQEAIAWAADEGLQYRPQQGPRSPNEQASERRMREALDSARVIVSLACSWSDAGSIGNDAAKEVLAKVDAALAPSAPGAGEGEIDHDRAAAEHAEVVAENARLREQNNRLGAQPATAAMERDRLAVEVERLRPLESRAARAEAEVVRLRGALEAINACISYSDTMEQWVLFGRERTRPALELVRAALSPAPEPAAQPKGLGALLGALGPFCERVPGCMCEPGHDGDCQVMAPDGKAETVAVKPAAPAPPAPSGALGEAIKMLGEIAPRCRHGYPDAMLDLGEVVALLSSAAAEHAALVKENKALKWDADCDARAAKERDELAARLRNHEASSKTTDEALAATHARVRELEAQLAQVIEDRRVAVERSK